MYAHMYAHTYAGVAGRKPKPKADDKRSPFGDQFARSNKHNDDETPLAVQMLQEDETADEPVPSGATPSQDERSDMPSQEELYAAVPPFQPPDGHSIAPTPDVGWDAEKYTWAEHACIHAHIHTHIHACLHAHIHAYIYEHIYEYIHAHIHAHIHTGTLGLSRRLPTSSTAAGSWGFGRANIEGRL